MLRFMVWEGLYGLPRPGGSDTVAAATVSLPANARHQATLGGLSSDHFLNLRQK
jgi:hypothetical protein